MEPTDIIEQVAQIDNIFALLAAMFLIFAVIAFRLFKKEKLWIRVCLILLIGAAGIYALSKINSVDKQELTKAMETIAVMDSVYTGKISSLEAGTKELHSNLALTNLRIKGLEEKRAVSQSDMDRLKREIETARLEKEKADSVKRAAQAKLFGRTKGDLDWIFKDGRARKDYFTALKNGKSRVDAAIIAQQHNSGVRKRIGQLDKEAAEKYLEQRERK